ncbi:MAG: hypothetical protein ABI760_09715 [Ferruginibacter sp.]
MNRFIIKSILFFLIIAMAIILIPFFFKNASAGSSDYMAAIIDKHRRIDIITSPKIILGGGSNLAFGIDSKELEKTFGMPVVNMGLHAGLGLAFILNELKYSIKENDIVFLSIEYFLDNEGDYALKKNVINFYRPANKFYSGNYFTEIDIYLEKSQKIFKNIFSENDDFKNTSSSQKAEIPLYSRQAFNQNGDIISHLDKPNPREIGGRSKFRYQYWEGIEEINRFYIFAKSRNVNVFFLFPNFPISEYDKNEKVISLLETDLRKDLKVEILNSPNSMTFPESYFFGTVYHLNKLGRKIRTNKMIEILNENADVQRCIFKSRSVKTIPEL